MWHKWKLLNALLTILVLPLLRKGARTHRQLGRLPADLSNEPLPSLSVIIPARNEAHNLRRLLPSLAAMKYPGKWEVIVVDDASTDETAATAEAFRARILRIAELPSSWLGKPHACHLGARAARGEWLLFTDADTVHASDGAARAIAYAVENQLDGLSLHLGQKTGGWLIGPAMLVAFAGLFAGLSSSTPMLNGQFILIRRNVYDASGGFSAVRHQAVEDLALGVHLRTQGYTIPILNGEELAHVHMYRDARQMWQGLMRLGSGSLNWSGRSAALMVTLTTGSMVPVLAFAAALVRLLKWKWSAATWAFVSSSYAVWGRRFGSLRAALLAPIGAVTVQSAACWGLLSRLVGRSIPWKTRGV